MATGLLRAPRPAPSDIRGAELTPAGWADEMLDKVSGVAAVVDRSDGGDSYGQAVLQMRELFQEPDATPSARLLNELRREGVGFFDYACAVAQKHKDYFGDITPLSPERVNEFADEASRSIAQQREIEASDKITFDEYLSNYFSQ